MDKYKKNRVHFYLSDLAVRLIGQNLQNAKLMGDFKTNKSSMMDTLIVRHLSNPIERQKETIRQLQNQLCNTRELLSKESERLAELEEINHVDKALSESSKKTVVGVNK